MIIFSSISALLVFVEFLVATSIEGIAMHSLEWLILIPLFPALGALLNGVLGRRYFSRSTIHLVACIAAGLSFLGSLAAFLYLIGLPLDDRTIMVKVYEWLSAGSFTLPDDFAVSINVSVEFLLDPLSAVMMLIVSGIGTIIHVYSTGYMWDEPGYHRYFSYLNLFLFSMLILVMSGNFLLLFVGWEGVGLCSYLLIGFYADRHSAANAGKKAFLVNRIGDAGFLLAIFMVFIQFGTLRFTDVFSQVTSGIYSLNDGVLVAIGLLMLAGVTGKSAQIPLYVWLPDAMEGPTPVSALIHAATMVTAGVYLIARCNAIYQMAPQAMFVVALIGALTALCAATIGTAQFDIKRVLAYSTVSQLGYMVMATGVGAFAAGIFHLMTHAFFKALLFLGSGSIIHALHHQQDMRHMGGLRKYLPTTFWTFAAATLAISGIPPFSGFFSKDEILWQSFAGPYAYRLFWALGTLAAGITAFYMFRCLFMTFFGEERFDEHTREHLHESPKRMTIPLQILAIGAIFSGFFGVPHVLQTGPLKIFHSLNLERFLEPSIYTVPGSIPAKSHHFSASVELGMMGLSVGIALVGILIAYLMYIKNPDLPARFTSSIGVLYNLVFRKYFVDEIYNALIIQPLLAFSRFLAWVDRNIIDGIVNGAAEVTRKISDFSARFDAGVVDGMVNGSAFTVGRIGQTLRMAHTGLAQSYVLGALTIALLTLTFYLIVW